MALLPGAVGTAVASAPRWSSTTRDSHRMNRELIRIFSKRQWFLRLLLLRRSISPLDVTTTFSVLRRRVSPLEVIFSRAWGYPQAILSKILSEAEEEERGAYMRAARELELFRLTFQLCCDVSLPSDWVNATRDFEENARRSPRSLSAGV